MIQPITLITAGIFFVVLFLRYRARPKDGPQRTGKQKLKTAKVMLAALVAWMAIHYSLQHTIAKMDGADQDPSIMERVVSFLSR
jgi:heme/copper-type cytochrome/quinol oxidase subunit 2